MEALPPDDNPFGDDKRSKSEIANAAYMDSLTKVASWKGSNSKTWNDASNKLAIKMHKQGYNYKEIWGLTQNIMGTDGNWRQEIDDSKSYLIPGATGDTLGDHVYHPELFAAYPGIENTPFDANWDNRGDSAGGKVQNGKISIGAYYAKDSAGNFIEIPLEDRLGTANHEWSHVIQSDKYEPAFSTGDNPRSDLSITVANDNTTTSTKAYLNKGGEHMAAASEARRLLDIQQRKDNVPDLTKNADGGIADRVTIDKTKEVPNFNTKYPSDRNKVVGNTKKWGWIDQPHVTFDNPYVTDYYPDPTKDQLDAIRKKLNVVKVDPVKVDPKPKTTKKVDPKVKDPIKPIKRPTGTSKIDITKKYGRVGKNGLGTMTSTGQVLDWKPKQDAPTGADGK